MKIDREIGEILPENVMQITEKAPAIIIDVSEVAKFHTDPLKLVEKINAQAGYMVFDVKTSKGRDACRSHAAQIIKCIAPACKESRRLADEAKKIVNQDASFRKLFDAGVREIAEYHRKPLTEWEAEQERFAEDERIFAEKIEAMRLYQLDWDDAIAFDELFTLRKEKAARDAEAAALKQLQEQEEYEKQLQAQAIIKERERHAQEIEQLKRDQEAQREKIQVEEETKARLKAEAEAAEKLEAENARITEENRLKQDRIEATKIQAEGIETAKIIEKNRLEDEKIYQRRFYNVESEEPAEYEIKAPKPMLSDEPYTGDFINIKMIEYVRLEEDSNRLKEIVKFWLSSERMLESAQRAPSSSEMRSEQMDALKIRQRAIDLIKQGV